MEHKDLLGPAELSYNTYIEAVRGIPARNLLKPSMSIDLVNQLSV